MNGRKNRLWWLTILEKFVGMVVCIRLIECFLSMYLYHESELERRHSC